MSRKLGPNSDIVNALSNLGYISKHGAMFWNTSFYAEPQKSVHVIEVAFPLTL
jgi:hypothetical protein